MSRTPQDSASHPELTQPVVSGRAIIKQKKAQLKSAWELSR